MEVGFMVGVGDGEVDGGLDFIGWLLVIFVKNKFNSLWYVDCIYFFWKIWIILFYKYFGGRFLMMIFVFLCLYIFFFLYNVKYKKSYVVYL